MSLTIRKEYLSDTRTLNMSLLAKLFGGGKSKQNTPTPAEAIQRLRGIEDVLIKKQDYLEKKIEQEIQTAKKNGSKKQKKLLMQGMVFFILYLINLSIGSCHLHTLQPHLCKHTSISTISPISFLVALLC
ncbi:charged multivesicular body protein 4-like [Tachypleus tridentatus]|uniref:charged multivesicular body protein 4-like n=1 Tax=Tachypleus tridentatus TaxID=6853 RepID=UPI003FD336F5